MSEKQPVTEITSLKKLLDDKNGEIEILGNTLENTRVANEKTIKDLKSEAQIRNMFIISLHRSNIAYKLELGRKLTLDEIEFLKKSCI